MPISTGGLITGTLEHLRRPLARNIKEGQNVLVLSDTEHDPRVWQAVMTILADLKAEAALALFSRRPADYYDPPPTICEAMLRSEVNVLVASTGMLHCAANMKAMAAGVPCLCLDGGMQLEWLQSGAITEDIRQMAVRKHYVAKDVFGEGAKICRVTPRYGTDFTYNVEGKIWTPPLPSAEFDPYKIVNYGTDDGRKGTKLTTYLYPTGELNVAPNDGTGNGKLVIDLTMHHLGRLNSPIELTIKDGRIIQIDGGADARILRDFLETYGDENAYMCPAEASVGVNAKAVVRGCQREDKNIIGAMHFGLGTNIDVGGTITSNIHLDGVILEPTLYVDGEMRIEHGRFLVPIEG
jgi:hypothetical protein